MPWTVVHQRFPFVRWARFRHSRGRRWGAERDSISVWACQGLPVAVTVKRGHRDRSPGGACGVSVWWQGAKHLSSKIIGFWLLVSTISVWRVQMTHLYVCLYLFIGVIVAEEWHTFNFIQHRDSFHHSSITTKSGITYLFLFSYLFIDWLIRIMHIYWQISTNVNINVPELARMIGVLIFLCVSIVWRPEYIMKYCQIYKQGRVNFSQYIGLCIYFYLLYM